MNSVINGSIQLKDSQSVEKLNENLLSDKRHTQQQLENYLRDVDRIGGSDEPGSIVGDSANFSGTIASITQGVEENVFQTKFDPVLKHFPTVAVGGIQVIDAIIHNGSEAGSIELVGVGVGVGTSVGIYKSIQPLINNLSVSYPQVKLGLTGVNVVASALLGTSAESKVKEAIYSLDVGDFPVNRNSNAVYHEGNWIRYDEQNVLYNNVTDKINVIHPSRVEYITDANDLASLNAQREFYTTNQVSKDQFDNTHIKSNDTGLRTIILNNGDLVQIDDNKVLYQPSAQSNADAQVIFQANGQFLKARLDSQGNLDMTSVLPIEADRVSHNSILDGSILETDAEYLVRKFNEAPDGYRDELLGRIDEAESIVNGLESSLYREGAETAIQRTKEDIELYRQEIKEFDEGQRLAQSLVQ